MKFRMGLSPASVALIALSTGVACAADSDITIQQSSPQELTVVLHGGELSDADRLAQGDQFWNQGEIEMAAREYRQVAEGSGVSGLENKARYRLGLCYLRQGNSEAATRCWAKVIAGEAPDPDAVAWSQYCLAWLDAAQGKAEDALSKLQGIIDAQLAKDTEIYAWSYYQIGRIQQQVRHDLVKADAAYSKVMTLYPSSKPAMRKCWQ